MSQAISAERRRLTAKILADAIGDPKSMASAEVEDDMDSGIEDEGGPQRRPGRQAKPAVFEFPYEDNDHRGVCGGNEVSQ
jgi:hypothetical protein